MATDSVGNHNPSDAQNPNNPNDTNHLDELDDDVSALARRLAARRRIVDGRCVICSTPFTGTRKKKFCSHACVQRSYKANKANKMAARVQAVQAAKLAKRDKETEDA
jgi:hypothetical protein